MQSYLKFIKDTSLLLGFDLDNRLESKPKVAKLLTIWKFIVPIFYVINLFQLFGYLHSPNLGYHQRIISFLTILVTIQGILRFFVIYMGIAKMMNLIKKIEKLQKTRFKENHSVSGSKFIEIIQKIGTITSRVIVFAPMIYVIIGNVKIFISFVMKTPLDEIMVIGLYWPFDPYNYLPWTFIYIYLMEFLKTTTVLITDHVTILTTACLSLCFESLANEVEEIFKGAKNRSFRDTKQKLIDFVEVHIQLRTLCDELNGLHGISLLTFFVLQSVVTCILGFEAMVSFGLASNFLGIFEGDFCLSLSKKTILIGIFVGFPLFL